MPETAPGQRIQNEPSDNKSDEATFERLARRGPVEYDRTRKGEAMALGCGVTALDMEVAKRRRKHRADASGEGDGPFVEIEPWYEPVDGGALLETIARVVEQHLVLPPCAADSIALWVLHSHTHDTASISPILCVTSPTPECGKSTLLIMLAGLVPKPLPSSNISAAALFRSIQKWKPTILVDEADTFLKGSDELRGIINSGHNRGTAFVIRSEGDNFEPIPFNTWGPKAIALIGKLPATVASRAIHIELRRMSPGETVEPTRADRLSFLTPLHRQAARWAEDNRDLLAVTDPVMPSILRGRAADNWRHLFAIAEAAGGGWPERARLAAEAMIARDSGQTAEILLLEDMRGLLAECDKIPSMEVARQLGEREDRPWSEWKNGKPITPRQIAGLLEGFDIAPSTIRTSFGTAKGYRAEQFSDAFSRYLSPTQSVTPSQPTEIIGSSPFESVTHDRNVTDQDRPKATDTNTCDGVTPTDGEAEEDPFHIPDWLRR